MALDMSLDRKAADLVSEALDLLGKKGNHWIRGDMKVGMEDPRFCAVGALREAAFGEVRNPLRYLRDHPQFPVYHRAVQMVASATRDNSDYLASAPVGTAEGRVVNFNDSSARTFPEVREVFTKAVRRLRGK